MVINDGGVGLIKCCMDLCKILILNNCSGTLIDAARSGTGSVSRFIRSRSEDSVCNATTGTTSGHQSKSIRASGSRSNSAGSDDGVTGSPTDSNPSVDKPDITASSKTKSKEHNSHLYGKCGKTLVKPNL